MVVIDLTCVTVLVVIVAVDVWLVLVTVFDTVDTVAEVLVSDVPVEV